jgi:hypothetical protein
MHAMHEHLSDMYLSISLSLSYLAPPIDYHDLHPTTLEHLHPLPLPIVKPYTSPSFISSPSLYHLWHLSTVWTRILIRSCCSPLLPNLARGTGPHTTPTHYPTSSSKPQLLLSSCFLPVVTQTWVESCRPLQLPRPRQGHFKSPLSPVCLLPMRALPCRSHAVLAIGRGHRAMPLAAAMVHTHPAAYKTRPSAHTSTLTPLSYPSPGHSESAEALSPAAARRHARHARGHREVAEEERARPGHLFPSLSVSFCSSSSLRPKPLICTV